MDKIQFENEEQLREFIFECVFASDNKYFMIETAKELGYIKKTKLEIKREEWIEYKNRRGINHYGYYDYIEELEKEVKRLSNSEPEKNCRNCKYSNHHYDNCKFCGEKLSNWEAKNE